MKVYELIKKLQQLPQDLDVYIPKPEYWEGDTELESYDEGPAEEDMALIEGYLGSSYVPKGRRRKNIKRACIL